MIVAVLSDVHANLTALDSVLASVDSTADAYVCLGDTVDYGPWNDECLERIDALPRVAVVEGNHERLFRTGDGPELANDLVREFYRTSAQWFARRGLISSLPASVSLGRFTCQHTIAGQRIYPDTDLTLDGDYVIGHSHHQFLRRIGPWTIVNPGSVGQNRAVIDRAEFALYDTETDEWLLRSVEYDFDAFLDELRTRDYPSRCIDYYRSKARSVSVS